MTGEMHFLPGREGGDVLVVSLLNRSRDMFVSCSNADILQVRSAGCRHKKC